MTATTRIAASATAILEALREDGAARELRRPCGPWSKEAAGERLRTFVGMPWHAVSPETFALRGWRYEGGKLVCVECGTVCSPDNYEHSSRCVWYGVALPSSIWDDDDDPWIPLDDDDLFECRLCGEKIHRDDLLGLDDAGARAYHRWFCPYRRVRQTNDGGKRSS